MNKFKLIIWTFGAKEESQHTCFRPICVAKTFYNIIHVNICIKHYRIQLNQGSNTPCSHPTHRDRIRQWRQSSDREIIASHFSILRGINYHILFPPKNANPIKYFGVRHKEVFGRTDQSVVQSSGCFLRNSIAVSATQLCSIRFDQVNATQSRYR